MANTFIVSDAQSGTHEVYAADLGGNHHVLVAYCTDLPMAEWIRDLTRKATHDWLADRMLTDAAPPLENASRLPEGGSFLLQSTADGLLVIADRMARWRLVSLLGLDTLTPTGCDLVTGRIDRWTTGEYVVTHNPQVVDTDGPEPVAEELPSPTSDEELLTEAVHSVRGGKMTDEEYYEFATGLGYDEEVAAAALLDTPVRETE